MKKKSLDKGADLDTSYGRKIECLAKEQVDLLPWSNSSADNGFSRSQLGKSIHLCVSINDLATYRCSIGVVTYACPGD